MANYGRGWGDGYGHQSKESADRYADEEAVRDGDWAWLEKSPRQQRLRREQGLGNDEYARDTSHD